MPSGPEMESIHQMFTLDAKYARVEIEDNPVVEFQTDMFTDHVDITITAFIKHDTEEVHV
jgi:hypothetical protein